MPWTYHCPKCDALLNPDRSIILLAEHDDRQHLIGFHPEPGNYEIYIPPGTEPQTGDRWDFQCPVCRQNLGTKENENLCALTFKEGDSHQQVLFSRVAGERVTFVVSDRKVQHRHGDHADQYEQHLIQMKYLL